MSDETLRNRIGCLDTDPSTNDSNNLAIALCSYFEDSRDRPEDDPIDDELAWSKWVVGKCNAALDVIADFVLKDTASLRSEVETLRAERAEFGVLTQPSQQALAVFAKVVENDPDADMRAIPNQWLLNERGVSQVLSDSIATREAERDRCRRELEEATKELKRYRDEIGTHSADCWGWGKRHYECAIGHITKLQRELEEERAKSQWVSVEERLPPIGKEHELLTWSAECEQIDYLTFWGMDAEPGHRWFSPWSGNFQGEKYARTISHWMPLPHPPGEKS